jgi:hypothetical protein
MLYTLAVISTTAAVAAVLFGPEWIESLTGLEPDGGNGMLELLVIALPIIAGIGLGLLGHSLRQRASA